MAWRESRAPIFTEYDISCAIPFQTPPLLQELMPFKAVVVSTGGGAVVRPQNWGFMHHGVVVWLAGSPELLSRRALRDGTGSRPLLSQNNGQTQDAVSPTDLNRIQ